MSSLLALYGALGAGAAGGSAFAPTLIGRAAADGNTGSFIAENIEFGANGADAFAQLWLVTSATDCFIRIGGSAVGNSVNNEDWFNAAGVAQGAPGVNENVFQLNERPDSVNIFTAANSGSANTLLWSAAFTDDDKTTFFNPTDTSEYGYDMQAQANDPFGTSIITGVKDMAFTFRKAGFADLTATYRINVYAEAEDIS